MHMIGISRLSTLIQRMSELYNLLRLELQLLKVPSPGHVYHAPGLARPCCEVMTPQRYRYIGAVESHLNYPRTKYGAPTGSSARDRASTITHFESSLHVDLAMFN